MNVDYRMILNFVIGHGRNGVQTSIGMKGDRPTSRELFF